MKQITRRPWVPSDNGGTLLCWGTFVPNSPNADAFHITTRTVKGQSLASGYATEDLIASAVDIKDCTAWNVYLSLAGSALKNKPHADGFDIDNNAPGTRPYLRMFRCCVGRGPTPPDLFAWGDPIIVKNSWGKIDLEDVTWHGTAKLTGSCDELVLKRCKGKLCLWPGIAQPLILDSPELEVVRVDAKGNLVGSVTSRACPLCGRK